MAPEDFARVLAAESPTGAGRVPPDGRVVGFVFGELFVVALAVFCVRAPLVARAFGAARRLLGADLGVAASACSADFPLAGLTSASVALPFGLVASLAAARRALARCGRVRGSFASTPPSSGGVPLVSLLASASVIFTSLLKLASGRGCDDTVASDVKNAAACCKRPRRPLRTTGVTR